MGKTITESKVLRVDDYNVTIQDVRSYERMGYVTLKMEKLDDSLWFHMVKYEED